MTTITLSDALPAGTYVINAGAPPNGGTDGTPFRPNPTGLKFAVTDLTHSWVPSTNPPSTIAVVNNAVEFTIVVPEGYSTKGKTPPNLTVGEATTGNTLQVTQVIVGGVDVGGRNSVSFVTADDPRPNHGVLYVGDNSIKFTLADATEVVANYRSWP